jgi:Na+/glutamate symporter
MIAFFTSIGFGASLSLLRSGGPAVALFWARDGGAVAQNLAGARWPLLSACHPSSACWRAR